MGFLTPSAQISSPPPPPPLPPAAAPATVASGQIQATASAARARAAAAAGAGFDGTDLTRASGTGAAPAATGKAQLLGDTNR